MQRQTLLTQITQLITYINSWKLSYYEIFKLRNTRSC